jgi:secreted PhoX family phosphatase
VPSGYDWHTIVRWGDPLFSDSPAFNPEVPDAEAQERQFGYNNDYTDILVTDRLGRRALLCCNHEYTKRQIMFPPTSSAAVEREVLKATMAAHGFSVVELRRAGRGWPWRYVRDGDKNRRITAYTPFAVTGPAAGSDLLKTAADPTGRRVLGRSTTARGDHAVGHGPVGGGELPQLLRGGWQHTPADPLWADRHFHSLCLRLGGGRPPLRRDEPGLRQ